LLKKGGFAAGVPSMIKHEYRSFVVKNGAENATAEYQEVFGYRLVSCAYSLSGVRMVFQRDISSPLYPLWRREEKLHYHLINDEHDIQKEINYVDRKTAFPTVGALIFWLLMLAGLAVGIWMACAMSGVASPIEGSSYYFGVSLLVFITDLVIYIVLVVSHRKKWVLLREGLEKDLQEIARIDRCYMNDLAKSNRVPEVPFDRLHEIENKNKLGIGPKK
jgi:hypothetical protein